MSDRFASYNLVSAPYNYRTAEASARSAEPLLTSYGHRVAAGGRPS